MAVEQIELIVNHKQALNAYRELAGEALSTEKTIEGAAAKEQAKWQELEKFLVTSMDRRTQATNRHIEALERQNAAYNKTPIERLNALRDIEIQKIRQSTLSLDEQAAAIGRVNAVFERRIALESASNAAIISDTRASTVAFKALEGGFANNTRAAAVFASKIAGLGPLLQAAFPLFGALAFIGVLEVMGEKVYKFIQEVQNAPAKIQAGFRDLNNELRTSNDELQVTNDRLTNNIAKLEHRPQNVLKLELDEARVYADKLAESLDKDLDRFRKLLEENNAGWFRQMLGIPGTEGIQKEFFGTTGFGGFKHELDVLTDQGRAKIEAAAKAGDKAGVEHATSALNTALLTKYEDKLKEVNGQIATTSAIVQRLENAAKVSSTEYRRVIDDMERHGIVGPTFQPNVLAGQLGEREYLQLNIQKIREQEENRTSTAKEKQLEAAKAAQDTTQQLREELGRKQAEELTGLEKINKEYEVKRKHLEFEGQATTRNLQILREMQKLDEERYRRDQARQTANAQFDATRSYNQAVTRGQYSIFQANRRASGARFGMEDITAEYNYAMGQAESERDAANHHIELLRQTRAAEGEIKRAEIDRDAAYERAAHEAWVQREVQKIDLKKQEGDLEDKIAKAAYDNSRKLSNAQAEVENRIQQNSIRRQSRMIEMLGGKTTPGQLQSAASIEQLMIAAAQNQYNYNEGRIASERAHAQDQLNRQTDPNKRIEWENKLYDLQAEHIKNLGQKQEEIDAAHDQRIEKIIQLEMKEFEEIKGKTEGLLHTAITNPKNFGKQLSTTIRDAALHPVEEAVSTKISNEIYKAIHGHLPGHGPETKLADLKVGTVDDSLKVYVTNLPGASRTGGSVGGGYTPAPWAGGGFSPAAITRMMMGGGFSPVSGTAGDNGVMTSSTIDFGNGPEYYGSATYGPGGASGGFSPTSIFGGGGNGGGGLLNQVLGGGFSKGSNAGFHPTDILKNLKNTDWGSFSRNASGRITGVNGVAGAGLMAGGTMLAEQGLLGSSRGTWGGVAEGTLGGAMIGMKLGGPLGAAIGAAAGFGIGLGEKIAGVESPQAEAKRLVKQLYHVNIDNSMADQIVSIAKSKYANHVSIAVRDPDVRKMLELYAAGTGQKMPQSATTPHGASLVEQGGTLYQAQTYQYGVGYAFQSSLPVAGGYSPNLYPNAGGPINLSLSIGGKGAADFLAGNVVTSDYVQAAWNSAAQSSNGRVNNSAMTYSPGLIVS